jgi:hypothetical protein
MMLQSYILSRPEEYHESGILKPTARNIYSLLLSGW